MRAIGITRPVRAMTDRIAVPATAVLKAEGLTIAGLTLAGLAMAGLAGCGTVRAPGGESRATVPAARSSGPSGGQRAAATVYARELLASLRLPGAAHRTPWPAPVPRSLRPMLPAALKMVVDLRELFRVGWPIARVNGFLTAHVPTGLMAGYAGQAGNVQIAGATAYYVSYNPRVLPHGIYDATLGTAVIPASGGSLLRVDAQVAWYPPRSAAEHIEPHRYRAVTVTAPRRYGGPGPMVTRTFAAPAVVTRLAALVNAMPAMPDIVVNCPAMSDTTIYRLRFIPAAKRWPEIAVTMPGCVAAGVAVGGRPQPALDYGGTPITAVIDRLLGLARASGG